MHIHISSYIKCKKGNIHHHIHYLLYFIKWHKVKVTASKSFIVRCTPLLLVFVIRLATYMLHTYSNISD